MRDINTTPTSGSGSSPGEFVEFQGRAFFTAYSLETGREIWESDGTEAGTVLLKDIVPGPSGSDPRGLKVVNGALFFFANDGVHGQELWKSDGTEAGTVLVKDIATDDGSAPRNLAAASGTLFFAATDEIHGRELWRSDGTEEGTALVQDLAPGSYPGQPSSRAAMHLLDAFVHQVESLSARQISGPAGASLVEFAGEIVALLGDDVPRGPNVIHKTGADRFVATERNEGP